ncbi:BTAD domain-containing putative transcriptional regulator [Kutzneria kofuensis]|uniref:DNA-binding SARP family transcriptional activator/Flp pilus assembly protein TadD n=1 Tax=Kutzneria kofuensis TaxID=103725 RepID=A0A7W9KC62_9PSEU|nr:BTAD domain-containing putative transcriptional regulator [Kutzneria kofuensis]MBB5889114.1 DNA-binding SARP family transcriptional activator/Flp pilus assembly protein TadD [Kutzneria kofuensis]
MTIIEETARTDLGQLRIGLLGPVRAWLDDTEVPVGPPRQQALLAVLATNANQVISRSELIDAIWGTEPPASAVGSVHTYVAGLRRALEPARKTFQVLVSAGSGYSLRVQPEGIDAERFARHRQTARQLLAGGDLEAALAELDLALGLWAGTPLGSIGGPFADIERQRLAELRLDVIEERADLLLTLRRPAEVVGELKAVLDDHPLRESTRALLITALHREGRKGEAKSVYQAGARLLDERLGVQPGPALRRVYETLIDTTSAAEVLPRVVPSQLPHDTRRFTGRGEELRRLDALLPAAGAVNSGGTVVITTIEGTAGIGKTSLAVHWSHLVRDLFPDGQVYLNLRGFDVTDKPVQPHDALFTLLSAFRVPSEKIPQSTHERSAMLRNVVAGRRMLMVLDNAVSTDQVTPLLPANQSCVVLVTSRNRLDGLVATGDGRQLTLGLFDEVDSSALLASYLSPERVEQEREAFDELLKLCAGLPLALSIVGARAWCSPNLPLAQFVDELRDAHFRLDALDTGDDAASSVRAVFSWSYDALSPAAKRMFRLLGLHTGPDVSRHAAGALADVTEDEARHQLDELVRAHLLELRTDGRYQFHDLLRVYALERATSDETDDERDAAARRAVRWYLHAANQADRAMLAFKPVHNIIDPPAHWSFPEQSDPEHAKAWFMAEETNLVEAIRRAVELGEHAVAWRLPQTMSSFWYVYNKRWELWAEMLRISLEHAVLDGDVNGEASAHSSLGIVANDLRRYEEAVDHYHRAIALFPRIDEKWLVGITYNSLGHTYVGMGKLPEAMAALRQAAEAYEEIGNTWGRAWALQGTASAYNAMGDHEKALEYGLLTLAAWHDVDYTHGIGSGLNLLGEIHLAAGDYEAAIDYYDQAVQARQSINDRFGIANALRGKALAEWRAGRVDEARESYRQALPILTALESPELETVEAELAQLDAEHP